MLCSLLSAATLATIRQKIIPLKQQKSWAARRKRITPRCTAARSATAADRRSVAAQPCGVAGSGSDSTGAGRADSAPIASSAAGLDATRPGYQKLGWSLIDRIYSASGSALSAQRWRHTSLAGTLVINPESPAATVRRTPVVGISWRITLREIVPFLRCATCRQRPTNVQLLDDPSGDNGQFGAKMERLQSQP